MAKIKIQNTQKEVLDAYKASGQFSSDDAFAEWLGISRQTLVNWRKEQRPDVEMLQTMAVSFAGSERGLIAVDLLKVRGELFIPCVCMTEVGDRGICPKHGVVEVGHVVA